MADSKNAGKVGDWMKADHLAQKLCPGDLVEIHRGPIYHWGVSMGTYDGNSIIVHVTGDFGTGLGMVVGKRGTVADIRVEELTHAVGADSCRFNNTVDDAFPPFPTGDMVVKRGLSKLGEHDYSVWANNCEHWASWCRNGHMLSQQVLEKELEIAEKKAAPRARLDCIKKKIEDLKTAGIPPPPTLPTTVTIPKEMTDKLPFLKKFDKEKLTT